MSDSMMAASKMLGTLTDALDGAEAVMKANTVETELATWAKAHQERYQEMPASTVVERKRKQLQEAWAAKAAAALTPVDHTYRAALPVVEQAEREAQQAPDLVAALTHGGGSHTRAEYLAALGVDEQIQSRLRHELPGLSPAQVHVRYEAALVWPNDLRANATVRAVESGMLDGWLGTGGGTPEVAAQWQRLSNHVHQVRRSRIPQEVLRLRGAVEYAKSLSHDAHGRLGLPWWSDPIKEPTK